MSTSTAANVSVIAPGTIFASSWGYDQTNVDFYRVIKASAKTVTLAKIGQGVQSVDSWASECVIPVKDQFEGEAFRRKINYSFGEPTVAINSYEYARLWDGKPAFQSHWA
ncbi:MAG: hypothetical protein ACTHUY_01100 [Flaviflexus sp.]|uniref:hypothetical protein n=1 Tax=Flaviflexus sp. TaxID=1969482 RepID=UPI003F8F2915